MTKTKIIETINETFAGLAADKNGKIKLDVVQSALMDAFATRRTEHPKINDDGAVWCNFHQTYEPADQFDTFTDKNGNERYKSSCRVGLSDQRKIKRLRAKIEREIMSRFRTIMFDADRMAELYDMVESAQTLDDVNHVWDVVTGKYRPNENGGEK